MPQRCTMYLDLDLAVAHLVVLGQLAAHANAIEINRFAPCPANPATPDDAGVAELTGPQPQDL